MLQGAEEALERRPFRLENPMGRVIRGHVVEAGRAAKEPPTVFLVHGYKGFKDWGFFPLLAQRIARAGIRVVAFNMSGSGIGEDEENFTETEAFETNTYSQELLDLQTVVQAFTSGDGPLEEPPAGATGLFGHSRGGGIALLGASTVPRLRTVVTWASIARTHRWDAETVARWREQGFLPVVNSRTGQVFHLRTDLLEDVERNAARLDIEAAVRGLTLPVLFVHGTRDASVDAAESRRLFAWITAHSGESGQGPLPEDLARLPMPEGAEIRWGPEGSLLVLVPGAEHTFGATHPMPAETPPTLEAVVELTVAWFRSHLLAPASGVA
jgi:pimeloyl-ACP methyl ester carboxylesterase